MKPQIYSEKDILKAQLQVARRTRMADFAIGIHHDLHGPDAPVPEGEFPFRDRGARGVAWRDVTL